MSDLGDLVEEFQDHEGIYSFEGERGIANLEKLVAALGYRSHGFKYGTLVEVFLADNSAAIEAIVEWIKEQHSEEWKDALESELPEKDEDGDCPPMTLRPNCGELCEEGELENGDEFSCNECRESGEPEDDNPDDMNNQRCPGCGKAPGEGLSSDCHHPYGCGYWRDEADAAYDRLAK
jgi:hypothetical protein